MALRAVLLCTVFLAALVAGRAARRRYGAVPPRYAQRRFGTPFTGDIHKQSFQDYLASNGVSFDSLFEEPTDLLSSEPAPAGRRNSPPPPPPPRTRYEDDFPPRAPYEDDFPPRPEYRDPVPLPPPSDFRRQQRPQTFLYGDELPSYPDEPLSYGDLAGRGRPYAGPGSGYSDLGSAARAETPAPEVRKVVVRRPERPRRPVVELRPAPAAAGSEDLQERRDLTLSIDLDQPQAAAKARQDGYSLNIPEKKEKQRLEFQVHGQEGPHSYRFGYDTGTGYNRQFRFEERDGYGNTKGRYGFYDKSGKLQVVNYSASPKGGFHAEGGFGKYPNGGH